MERIKIVCIFTLQNTNNMKSNRTTAIATVRILYNIRLKTYYIVVGFTFIETFKIDALRLMHDLHIKIENV